jgi:hypothetical protein
MTGLPSPVNVESIVSNEIEATAGLPYTFATHFSNSPVQVYLSPGDIFPSECSA